MDLLLDSSGSYLVAGLADSAGFVIATAAHASGSAESRDLSAVVEGLLQAAGQRKIDGVIAGTGPGTFIGTRLAVSFANGLAAAAGCELRGVNSLAAIAAVQTSDTAVIRDARQGQVYLLHNGPGHANVELVSLVDLAQRLALPGTRRAVLDAARPGDPKGAERAAAIVAALARIVEVVQVDKVPVEGIWLAGRNLTPQDYIEPEYCKGFT